MEKVTVSQKEAKEELESMGKMRLRLHEHILYLQNEVRKRDELLESTSDFNIDSDADESIANSQFSAAPPNNLFSESVASSPEPH